MAVWAACLAQKRAYACSTSGADADVVPAMPRQPRSTGTHVLSATPFANAMEEQSLANRMRRLVSGRHLQQTKKAKKERVPHSHESQATNRPRPQSGLGPISPQTAELRDARSGSRQLHGR